MTTPVDEVVDLVSALIRFDTSNTGELENTPSGSLSVWPTRG